MRALIIKLNATGDVVRTTCLLHRLNGHVTWLTASANVPLLQGVASNLRCLAWDNRDAALDEHYDLLVNLEDDPEPRHSLDASDMSSALVPIWTTGVRWRTRTIRVGGST